MMDGPHVITSWLATAAMAIDALEAFTTFNMGSHFARIGWNRWTLEFQTIQRRVDIFSWLALLLDAGMPFSAANKIFLALVLNCSFRVALQRLKLWLLPNLQHKRTQHYSTCWTTAGI
mmetsp:Transcript_71033/g.141105  ORF Transcript_71033/g.141105 Transcript_71033/m.141105 type:complete len:118 (+) Transcript_71033:174-527(+)